MSTLLVQEDLGESKMKNNNVVKPNEISEGTKMSMKTRIIVAVIGLCVVLPPFFLGDWFFLALVLALTVIGCWEIVHCGKKGYSFWLYFVTITVGVLCVNWPLFQGLINDLIQGNPSHGHAFDYFRSMYLSLPVMFIGICLLFLVAILHQSFTVKDGCFITAMVVIVSLGLQGLLFVRYFSSFINNQPRDWFNSFDNFASCSFAAYGVLGTFMTDIGAYFVGVFFGKNKINERISPKKTYEGFWGGIVISALVTMAFAFILSATGHSILPRVYDLEHWYNIVFMSILMPFMATLGDFVFSAVKRYYEIKDFGNIMPGHGGVLDRLDSIVFVFASLALFTLLFFGLAYGVNGVKGLFV